MKRKNPFVINGYDGPEYFCDREYETQRLVDLLTNGNNVVLTSQRRVGKTDLISHLFAQKEISEDYLTIYVDAYPTRNLSEFIIAFGKAVTDALMPRGKAAIDKFVMMLSSLRAELSLDFQGLPVWSVGLGPGVKPEITLDEIFKYLNSSKIPCIVAIDEFQQITNYPDGDRIEALMRSYVQRSPDTQFIFAGSNRHLITEMFTSGARPFFQSATLLGLPLIPKEKYLTFCTQLFESYGKHLAPEVIDTVYERFRGITLYMHKVLNEIFITTSKGETAQLGEVDQAIEKLIRDGHEGYSTLYNQLSERQRELLLAIARDGEAKEINSAAFIRRHKLTSQSAVASTTKLLLEKDLITRDGNTYTIYDQIFGLWLRRSILSLNP
ncbi:MAG: ATPase [Bacteroidales bacterium]|nr:ATPase [Bacteroidales bacterium]